MEDVTKIHWKTKVFLNMNVGIHKGFEILDCSCYLLFVFERLLDDIIIKR